jgi:hypothetical protein
MYIITEIVPGKKLSGTKRTFMAGGSRPDFFCFASTDIFPVSEKAYNKSGKESIIIY